MQFQIISIVCFEISNFSHYSSAHVLAVSVECAEAKGNETFGSTFY